MNTTKSIKKRIKKLRKEFDKKDLVLGEILFFNGACQILSQSAIKYELIVTNDEDNLSVEYAMIFDEDGNVFPVIEGEVCKWDKYAIACLLLVENEMHLLDPKEHVEHKKYTRAGMIKRVVMERQQKAEKAEYHINWAGNIYGDHILTNDKGVQYKVFLRDFENETGYSNSPDAKFNKLGPQNISCGLLEN